jgi:hypothetical protein
LLLGAHSAERAVEAWTPADDFPAAERDRLVWYPAGAAVPFGLMFAQLSRTF